MWLTPEPVAELRDLHLDVVRALADEVVVLRAGRVVESGPPGRVARPPPRVDLVEQGPARRILTGPRHPFTVALRETIAGLDTYTRA